MCFSSCLLAAEFQSSISWATALDSPLKRPAEVWGAWAQPAAREAIAVARGCNGTGCSSPGNRSGDWLSAALWRTGCANPPQCRARDDGLRLRGCWITAAVRCAPPANRATPQERDRCLPYTARELELLDGVSVLVCLGAYAWDAALRLAAAGGDDRPRPRPRFGHGAEVRIGARTLLGCFHPSQQNTFTGVLTEEMTDAVLRHARELAGLD